MTGWLIAGAVVLALALLCLLPVAAEAAYAGGAFTLRLRLGALGRQIFPAPAKKGKKKAKKEGGEPEKARGKERKAPVERDQLPALIQLALKTLKKFLKSLRIERLRLRFVTGGPDPADAAMAYIAAATAMEAFQDAAMGRVRGLDLRAETDFDADAPALEAYLTLSARAGRLIAVALSFFAGYLKIERLSKKQKGGT